jgi:hypothetical protein
MKNSGSFPFIAGLLLLLLFAFLIWQNQGKNFNWTENYDHKSKDPYDVSVIFGLLKSGAPGGEITLLEKNLPSSLPADPKKPSNYLFLGSGQYLDSADVEQLLKFVGNGNNAFIATRVAPFNLMFKLYFEECVDAPWQELSYFEDTAITVNLRHPGLRMNKAPRFRYRQKAKYEPYQWEYFEDKYFCVKEESPLVELGRFDNRHINFVKIDYGRGSFYLHSNPILFSNLHLVHDYGRSYAERVFGHLPPGPIFWDKYSMVRDDVARQMNNGGGYSRRGLAQRSPLNYVLSQPPLAWAWYVLVAIGLLFLLFRTKRQQRVVPVLPSNRNTSLEFIRSIGRLYFLQNKHPKLASQKMKLFLQFARERYGLHTRDLDQAFAAQLSTRSGVQEPLIQSILNIFLNAQQSGAMSEKTLIDFHQRIESFYKTCK